MLYTLLEEGAHKVIKMVMHWCLGGGHNDLTSVLPPPSGDNPCHLQPRRGRSALRSTLEACPCPWLQTSESPSPHMAWSSTF
eukprot:3355140-Amphidinium_carterae.1